MSRQRSIGFKPAKSVNQNLLGIFTHQSFCFGFWSGTLIRPSGRILYPSFVFISVGIQKERLPTKEKRGALFELSAFDCLRRNNQNVLNFFLLLVRLSLIFKWSRLVMSAYILIFSKNIVKFLQRQSFNRFFHELFWSVKISRSCWNGTVPGQCLNGC